MATEPEFEHFQLSDIDLDSVLGEESPEDEEAAEIAALLAAEERRWAAPEGLDDAGDLSVMTQGSGSFHEQNSSPWDEVAQPSSDRSVWGDLPALHEPPGYHRDRGGRWRYLDGGELVPGARDLTLDRIWRFRRAQGCVLVPIELTGRGHLEAPIPELGWCSSVALGVTDAPRTQAVDHPARHRHQEVWRIPIDEWCARAAAPLGLEAPELAIDRLLDVAGVARVAGIGQGTVRSYLHRGYLPGPVRVLGGSPLWSVPIVVRSLASRPGQGVRSVGQVRSA